MELKLARDNNGFDWRFTSDLYLNSRIFTYTRMVSIMVGVMTLSNIYLSIWF